MIRELFARWDAVLICILMLLMFAVLSIGVGVAVYLLVASFSPATLATSAGVLFFITMLSMFFRFLSE